jgi:pimeloyl-ACP methyl ester carboxylesterase
MMIPLLVEDVRAVIEGFGEDKAIICGHDWGGVVAWFCAMLAPDMVCNTMPPIS